MVIVKVKGGDSVNVPVYIDEKDIPNDLDLVQTELASIIQSIHMLEKSNKELEEADPVRSVGEKGSISTLRLEKTPIFRPLFSRIKSVWSGEGC